MLKKQLAAKPKTIDSQVNVFGTQNQPTPTEIQRCLDLFGECNEEFKPDYLQLPIKIESQEKRSQKLRKSSESYSQLSLLNENNKEDTEKNPNGQNLCEIEMIGSERSCYDMMEELLLPLANQEYNYVQHLDYEGCLLGNMESEDEKMSREMKETLNSFKKEVKSNAEIKEQQMIRNRKNLLSTINFFQTYNHSLNIVVNFHSLLKKDNLTKMYGSVLGVLSKESQKMEIVLNEDLKKISDDMKNTKRREERQAGNEELGKPDCGKELQNTMEGISSEKEVIVKEEHFEGQM